MTPPPLQQLAQSIARLDTISAVLLGGPDAEAFCAFCAELHKLRAVHTTLTTQLAAADRLVAWVWPMVEHNQTEHGRQMMTPFRRERMEGCQSAIAAYLGESPHCAMSAPSV